jgi:putative transcriptional regulator
MDRKSVRELRQGRKISREQLAVALGISFQTLVRIESQKSTPRLDVALRIAEYFSVAVEDIEWGKTLAVVA